MRTVRAMKYLVIYGSRESVHCDPWSALAKSAALRNLGHATSIKRVGWAVRVYTHEELDAAVNPSVVVGELC